MPSTDQWDEGPSVRRVAHRFRTRWKVALVFDGSPGKPIFKTLTYDLSMNGTSVQSDTDEPVHTVLTLLLMPPQTDGIPHKIVKLKSVVMSSTPFQGSYRLGMSFIQDPELDKLRAIMERFDLSGTSLPSDPEANALPKLF